MALRRAGLCLLLALAATAENAGSPATAPAVGASPKNATVSNSIVEKIGPTVHRCRIFYAHARAEAAGKDNIEYSTMLLWKEHAEHVSSPPGTRARTLAVNVTATEGARIVLSSAVRALPGQPRLELVLGTRANESRLLVQVARRAANESVIRARCGPRLLFEDGELRLWLKWTVRQAAANESGGDYGLLDVIAQPAGSSSPIMLFSFNMSTPIQLESFSFGSTADGDVAFSVCLASTWPGHPAGLNTHHDHGALSVPGCRSLHVHVQVSHEHTHNLAVGWSDTADHHGRLQIWARASTDVEVAVADSLNANSDHQYHVVFGGEFNTRSWVLQGGKHRTAEVPTPRLLSDSQFQPLWVTVSAHGDLSAGSGDLNNHHVDTPFRELLKWHHPHSPSRKFVAFKTYKNRLVHILLDCARSPSPPSPSLHPTEVTEILETARTLIASAKEVRLKITSLARHEGELMVAGSLHQEVQPTKDWSPTWVNTVRKIQFWPANLEKNVANITVSGQKSEEIENKTTDVGHGSIEIQNNKISWNFPLNIAMPCMMQNDTLSCSITLQLHTRFKQCQITAHLDHKWQHEWDIEPLNKIHDCILPLKMVYLHKVNNLYGSSSSQLSFTQQGQHKGWLTSVHTILTLATLICIVLGNKHLVIKKYPRQFSISFMTPRHSIEDSYDKLPFVDREDGTAQIIGLSSENVTNEKEPNHDGSIRTAMSRPPLLNNHNQPRLCYMYLTILLVIVNLLIPVIDLIVEAKDSTQ